MKKYHLIPYSLPFRYYIDNGGIKIIFFEYRSNSTQLIKTISNNINIIDKNMK